MHGNAVQFPSQSTSLHKWVAGVSLLKLTCDRRQFHQRGRGFRSLIRYPCQLETIYITRAQGRGGGRPAPRRPREDGRLPRHCRSPVSWASNAGACWRDALCSVHVSSIDGTGVLAQREMGCKIPCHERLDTFPSRSHPDFSSKNAG